MHPKSKQQSRQPHDRRYDRQGNCFSSPVCWPAGNRYLYNVRLIPIPRAILHREWIVDHLPSSFPSANTRRGLLPQSRRPTLPVRIWTLVRESIFEITRILDRTHQRHHGPQMRRPQACVCVCVCVCVCMCVCVCVYPTSAASACSRESHLSNILGIITNLGHPLSGTLACALQEARPHPQFAGYGRGEPVQRPISVRCRW